MPPFSTADVGDCVVDGAAVKSKKHVVIVTLASGVVQDETALAGKENPKPAITAARLPNNRQLLIVVIIFLLRHYFMNHCTSKSKFRATPYSIEYKNRKNDLLKKCKIFRSI
jgi:hypothetical protein